MAISHFVAYDPHANAEGIVTNFDVDALKLASTSGILFYSVDYEGNRTEVPVSDVHPCDEAGETLDVAKPSYIDDRMKLVVDVFDALASEMPAMLTIEMDEERASSPFLVALEALRKLACKSSENGA